MVHFGHRTEVVQSHSGCFKKISRKRSPIRTLLKLIAIAASCGLVASIVAYAQSFHGATPETLSLLLIATGIGAAAVSLSVYALGYPASKEQAFWSKGFSQGMPSWAAPCVYILWIIAVAHLMWFSVRSDFAGPTIVGGQYVLDLRGRIVKVLTEAEYLSLKRAELRSFAALIASCHVMPMLYGWFGGTHRNPR